MGAGALPRFEKRSAYSEEALAAIKQHEAMMKEARRPGVGHRGGTNGSSAGGDTAAAGKGRENRYTSQITRAPISAEAAEAAAAAAAMFSGGGARVWGTLASEEEGQGEQAALDSEEGVHWSRRRDTEKEDQERERAARNELVRGANYRASVLAVFSDDNERVVSLRPAPASSLSPHTAAGAEAESPVVRALSPARGAGPGDGDVGVGLGGRSGRKKSKPQQQGFAGVCETFQGDPPALIPQSALPFSMRLDGTMPSPCKSPLVQAAKYSKREAAVAELMLAEVPSMWPAGYRPPPASASPVWTAPSSPAPLGKAADASFAMSVAGRGGQGGTGGGNNKDLFRHELPDILDEVLATDKGINMAVDHFERFVKRLELEAKRREQHLARRQRALHSLRKTEAELCERSSRPVDQAPAMWHARKSAELADIEGQTRREQLRGGELEILLQRVTYEHEQTRKALERRELDLRGHSQDVATLTSQLNEAQMEAAHTFACLEKLCKTLAEQKTNMSAAALKRRALFQRKAAVAERELDAERRRRLADLEEQVRESEQARNLEKQHLMAMIRSGKRIEQLPYYGHAAMVLMGVRTDAPPVPDPPYAPRYDAPAAQALLDAENASDNCDHFLQGVGGIVSRFEDFRLTQARSHALIEHHTNSIAEHTQTLAKLQEEELEARTRLISHTEQRSMNVEYDDKTKALERAKVRERTAQHAMSKRRGVLASISESLLNMAGDVCRAVSLEEDAHIVILASKLHHASLMARPRIVAAGPGWHPVLELVETLDEDGFGKASKDQGRQHIKVRDMTPHSSFNIRRLSVSDLESPQGALGDTGPALLARELQVRS